MEYYKIPLLFTDLINKKELLKCRNLEESISQNIHLILTTQFGEYKQDSSYGCSIWENDFENINSTNLWKERMAKSIKEVLQNHEQRITNIIVKADIIQEEILSSHIKRLKKKVEVSIKANVAETNEPFSFIDGLYISPLSFD